VALVAIELVPVHVAALQAECEGDLHALAEALGVTVGEWPPLGGEWDRDAVEFFREALAEHGDVGPFGARYVVGDGALIGSAGFFGPPDDAGAVEIGYSVCTTHRRRGVATAVVGMLCDLAARHGAHSVIAHVRPDNLGSLRALAHHDFAEVPTDRPPELKFCRPFLPN
jgi:ribosomal-protein-alanine N-acetyltransferase